MVSIMIPLCAMSWKLPANGEDLFSFWIDGLGGNLRRRGLTNATSTSQPALRSRVDLHSPTVHSEEAVMNGAPLSEMRTKQSVGELAKVSLRDDTHVMIRYGCLMGTIVELFKLRSFQTRDERTRNLCGRPRSQPMPTQFKHPLHLSPRCRTPQRQISTP